MVLAGGVLRIGMGGHQVSGFGDGAELIESADEIVIVVEEEPAGRGGELRDGGVQRAVAGAMDAASNW